MKVSKRGQITIPKKLREKHGIIPGAEIRLIGLPEGILIRKRFAVSPFRKFIGKASARDLPRRTDDFLDLIRHGKDDHALGRRADPER